jgi:hypothetical protein
MLSCSKWTLPFRFSHQILYACIFPMRATCPTHLILLDLITQQIWWNTQVLKLLIMHSSPNSCHFLLLRSKYSPQNLVLKHPQSLFFP